MLNTMWSNKLTDIVLKDPLRWGIWCIFTFNHIDNLLLHSAKIRNFLPDFMFVQVLTRVGYVAYCLALPPCKIHLVFFYVSCLKKIDQQLVVELKLPQVNKDEQVLFEPLAILDFVLLSNMATTPRLKSWFTGPIHFQRMPHRMIWMQLPQD